MFDVSNYINHQITVFIDEDGSITITDFPEELTELMNRLISCNENF